MTFSGHRKITGFSGNEIFCLNQVGYTPGPLCLGNSVIALGIAGGLSAGISTLAGGEVKPVTDLIYKAREEAYLRMKEEAMHYGGVGLAGVTFDLVKHGLNLEFIALGSTLNDPSGDKENLAFSTSASGQELYCQLDAGFAPLGFVFGNVAYSIGIGGAIGGWFKSWARGEVDSYTEIFDRTRHLALERIKEHARQLGAHAVIGIQTSIMPILGAQEMMMVGTASTHPDLESYKNSPITSDLTNEELWNIVNIGYMPIELVMGVSVYSLGFISSVGVFLKSIQGGDVNTLTHLLYEAREKSFNRLQEDAKKYQADTVVGVKTYIYHLGGGLIEVMAIGTAVKKMPNLTTKSPTLIPQAIIQDRNTFINIASPHSPASRVTNENAESASETQQGPKNIVLYVILIILAIIVGFAKAKYRI